MRITSLILLSVVLTSQVHAQDYLIAGHGAQSCSFLNTYAKPGDGWGANGFTLGVMSWIQGYMSGTNVMVREQHKKFYNLATISVDEQWAYVVDFCHRNANQDISRAGEALMIQRLRMKTAPPIPEKEVSRPARP